MQELVVVLVDALMKYTSPGEEGDENSLYGMAQPGCYPGTGMPAADLIALQPRLIDSILLIKEPQDLQYFWDTALVICVNTLTALTMVHFAPDSEHRLENPLPDIVPYYIMLGKSTLLFGNILLGCASRS